MTLGERDRGTARESQLLAFEGKDLPLSDGLVMNFPLSFQVFGRFMVGLIVL